MVTTAVHVSESALTSLRTPTTLRGASLRLTTTATSSTCAKTPRYPKCRARTIWAITSRFRARVHLDMAEIMETIVSRACLVCIRVLRASGLQQHCMYIHVYTCNIHACKVCTWSFFLTFRVSFASDRHLFQIGNKHLVKNLFYTWSVPLNQPYKCQAYVSKNRFRSPLRCVCSVGAIGHISTVTTWSWSVHKAD